MKRMPSSILFRRRDMLKTLAVVVGSPKFLGTQERGLQFTRIEHIEFYVSNVEASRDFFARVFGNTILRNSTTPKRYLKLGASYMAFETQRAGAPAARVDHVSASIRMIDMAKVHTFLDGLAIAYRDYPSGR